MMDLSNIYNHSVLYLLNKMAFETPLAPGGLHFYFGPSGVKIRASTKNKAHLLMKMFFIWDDKSIGFNSSSVCQSRHFVLNLLFLDLKSFRNCEREIASRNYFPAILTAFLRESNRNEERCIISDTLISATCAPGNHWNLSVFKSQCADEKFWGCEKWCWIAPTIWNGKRLLYSKTKRRNCTFEVTGKWHQRTKYPLLRLADNLSKIALRLRHRHCLRHFFWSCD